MEDYLEIVYELVQHKGYATLVDVAEYLNVLATKRDYDDAQAGPEWPAKL